MRRNITIFLKIIELLDGWSDGRNVFLKMIGVKSNRLTI